MSVLEAGILTQLKKAQGETNQRLEALIAAQWATNELLARIAAALQRQAPRPAPYQADTPFIRTAPGQEYPPQGRR